MALWAILCTMGTAEVAKEVVGDLGHNAGLWTSVVH